MLRAQASLRIRSYHEIPGTSYGAPKELLGVPHFAATRQRHYSSPRAAVCERGPPWPAPPHLRHAAQDQKSWRPPRHLRAGDRRQTRPPGLRGSSRSAQSRLSDQEPRGPASLLPSTERPFSLSRDRARARALQSVREGQKVEVRVLDMRECWFPRRKRAGPSKEPGRSQRMDRVHPRTTRDRKSV